VAHFEAEIPQHVEHVFHDLLGMRRQLVGKQEKQIEVGLRRQLAAAIAAGGDHRFALARRGVGVGIDPLEGEVVERAHELIDQIGVSFGAGMAARARVAVGVEAALDLGAAVRQRVLQRRQHASARQRRGAPARNRIEPFHQLAPVDDGARQGNVGFDQCVHRNSSPPAQGEGSKG